MRVYTRRGNVRSSGAAPSSPDTHTLTSTFLVLALKMAGTGEAARAAADGLIEAAEATHNPWALANALYTYGYAFGDADPARVRSPAPGPGDRAPQRQSIDRITAGDRLSRLEAEHGDPPGALDHITLAVGNFYDSGMHDEDSSSVWRMTPER